MLKKLQNNFNKCFSTGPRKAIAVKVATAVVTVVVAVSAYYGMHKTVTLVIDGKMTTISTFRGTFKGALYDNNITVGPKDKTTPEINSKIKDGEKLYIKKAVNVEVQVDGKKLDTASAEDNVDKLLQAEGIYVDKYDKVLPARDAKISTDLKIQVIRVESKLVKQEVPVDYSVTYTQDDNSEKGVSTVVQEGQQGSKTISTKVVLEDGKEVAKYVINELLTKQPVQKIVAMGTLGSITPSRGGKLLYTRNLSVRATAYTADYASTGKSPGDRYYGITATGTRARRNVDGYSTIAVDPNVIPLGTKLWVEGYGFAIAEDTGGAIKGNTIDIYVNSEGEANNWGVRYVNVYVLK